MNDLLFDVPWWIPTLLAIIAIALFWNGNNRQKSGRKNAGIALLLVAVGWFLLSYFVDTDKEKAAKGTRQLLADVVDGKWDQFQAKLVPNASFRLQGGDPRADGAPEITQYAKAGAEAIQLRSAYIQSMETQQTGPFITVNAHIFSTQEHAAVPAMRSDFQFDWEPTSTGWKIREIRLIKIGDASARELDREIPKGTWH